MPDITIQVDDEDILDTNEAPRPKRVVNDAGFSELQQQLNQATKKADDAQKMLDGEKRRADEADARARRERDDASRARQDAATARTERNEDRKIALTNAVASHKALLDGLENEHAGALEAGDFKKASSIQRKMAEAAAELKQVETGLSSIEPDEPAGGDKRKPVEGRVERRQPQTPQEEFDAYVGQFSPRAQSWLRKHPETAAPGSRKNSELMAAHWAAEAKGITEKTDADAYFSFLDERMGYNNDAADAIRRDNPLDDNADDQQTGRSTQMRAAPVSRGNGRGGNSNLVTLTPGEADASENGSIVWNVGQTDHRGVRITDKDPRVGEPIGRYEMARRKRAMAKEGRYETPYAS